MILFRSSSAFFLCALQVPAGQDPITYISPVPGLNGKCVTITLQASGCGRLVEPSNISAKRADQGRILTTAEFIQIHEGLKHKNEDNKLVLTGAVDQIELDSDRSRTIGPSHYYGCTIVFAVAFDEVWVAHLSEESEQAGNRAVKCTTLLSSSDTKKVIKEKLEPEMGVLIDYDAKGCQQVFVIIVGNVPPATTGVVTLKDWFMKEREIPEKNIKYVEYARGGDMPNPNTVTGRAFAVWDHVAGTVGVYANNETPKLWARWNNNALVERPYGWA